MIVSRRRESVVATASYLVFLAFVATIRPFWLDEMLQLAGTRPGIGFADLIRYVPHNPGGVPLGYLIQHWTLQAFGLSLWAARLPSLVLGVAACYLMARLAESLFIRGVFAAALFAFSPILIRYSTEGRPYMQAVLLTIVLTHLFVQLLTKRTRFTLLAYGLVLVACLYTQPFSALVSFAHLATAAISARRLLLPLAACVAFSLAVFVPWWVYSQSGWERTIQESQFQFVINWKTPLLLLRELSGAGYLGIAVLIILSVLGWQQLKAAPQWRTLLLLWIWIPLIGGLTADALLGYFIASRQFLWCLPPLLLLAAAGIECQPAPGAVLVLIFAAGSGFSIYRYYSSPTENWEAATHAVESAMTPNSCFQTVPKSSAYIYEVYAPELFGRNCERAPSTQQVVAIPPYTSPGDERAFRRSHRIAAEASVGASRILVLQGP